MVESLPGTRPLFLALLVSVSGAVHAQDAGAGEEARRIAIEARAHEDAGRHALAFQRYVELHDYMQQARFPRAALALWNAGLSLMQVPGRERETLGTFRRFLDESTVLTEDPQIRDWRSTALEHISELEARVGDDEPAPPAEGLDGPVAPAAQPLSPVGPVLLGVGGASLLTGLVLGIVVLAQDGALSAMCPGGRCPEAAAGLANEIASFALASDVFTIGGGVVAAAGLLLTLIQGAF